MERKITINRQIEGGGDNAVQEITSNYPSPSNTARLAPKDRQTTDQQAETVHTGRHPIGHSDVMMCKGPYRQGVLTYGCGQCLPCRINKRREWTSRLQMERLHHAEAAFLTLTYNDGSMPKDLCVTKREAELFLKKLRAELAPRKIRYFMVGEYGDKSQRPHYHAIIFGLSPTEGQVVEKCWAEKGKSKGFIHIGTAETKSMAYCGSYVVKKWTKSGHPSLEGRNPEFSLMSKGIGKKFAERVVQTYQKESNRNLFEKQGWIETSYTHGGKRWPMGRYIKEKIYEGLAITKEQRKANNQIRNDKVAVESFPLTATEQAIREKNVRRKDDQNLLRRTIRQL